MTREQVAAAMTEEYVEHLGRTLKPAYEYDERGLKSVALNIRANACKDVYQALASAHGSPYRVSNQVLLTLFIWHDPPANNRLRLMASPSAGVCTLHYERLDDYKAVDDEQAAQGR